MGGFNKRAVKGRRRFRPADRPGAGDPRVREEMTRLLESEAQRLAHVGSWEWDAVRDVVTWSDELYRIYGVRPEDFDGTYESFLGRVYEPDRARTKDIVAQAFREGKPFDYDHRVVRADGMIRMLQTRGGVVRGRDGSVVRLVGCCMDVTEQWRTGKQLEESLSLLRTTLDSTADGIFVINLARRVVVCNQRAKEMWGLPEALAARGDLDAMIAHVRDQLADPGDFVEREYRLLSQPEECLTDTIRFKDGRVFERYTCPQRHGDFIVGRVCSFRDVTDRERALGELRTLAAELEQRVNVRTAELQQKSADLARSNAELEAFAGAASHDLSAPVRKMAAYGDLLERRAAAKLDEQERSLLAHIRKSAGDMAKLIGEILMLARVGREALPTADVSLDAVMLEVADDLEVELQKTGATLQFGGLPVVRGHDSLWRRLLQNLVANALKFRSPERPPRIVVGARKTEDGGVMISVEDNGIGFDPKYAREIFLPFRRLHPAKDYEGSGIGLATCDRIARRYGAEMLAASEPGLGSTFFVRLPGAALSQRPGA